MGEAALRIRRYILPRRIVEGRVHQHAARRSSLHALVRERAIRRRDIQHCHLHAAGQAVPRRIVFGKRRKRRIDLDQRRSQATDALRQREPCRAHTRAKLDRVTCAARFRRGREQDRIVPHAVAASAAGAR